MNTRVFFLLKDKTCCSREKGEPFYYKLMTSTHRQPQSVMHLSVGAASLQIDFAALALGSLRLKAPYNLQDLWLNCSVNFVEHSGYLLYSQCASTHNVDYISILYVEAFQFSHTFPLQSQFF